MLRLLRAEPGLRRYMATRVADELAQQILNVAIGWYIYDATGDALSLAYVGLAQFLPTICFMLIAGQVADHFDRRKIIVAAQIMQTVCVAVFTVWATVEPRSTAPVYILLVLMGAARAFSWPAVASLLPHIVREDEFPRAVAAVTSAFQTSSIAGPALGGLIYAISGPVAFGCVTALYLLATLQILRVRVTRKPAPVSASSASRSFLAGFRYVRSNRLLLGLISLDLFAVLLGGVTALLPIYAKDVLAVGPSGLGFLRCAPGVGAVIVGLFLAHRTIEHSAGKLMLWCVAGFGAATIAFALSTDFFLSLAALAAVGGFDMVSMVIRQTLEQISTPDAMRGRVSAVNGLFISASNELGEFESGAVAALLGVVPAAVVGGFGTLAVVALWAWAFPEIRRADKLTAPST